MLIFTAEVAAGAERGSGGWIRKASRKREREGREEAQEAQGSAWDDRRRPLGVRRRGRVSAPRCGCAILICSAPADRDGGRPNGTPEWSRGWSEARREPGEAQHVEIGFDSPSCPGGAEEVPKCAADHSNTHCSSNSISAPSGSVHASTGRSDCLALPEIADTPGVGLPPSEKCVCQIHTTLLREESHSVIVRKIQDGITLGLEHTFRRPGRPSRMD